MSQYNAAYLNALSEERDHKLLFEWVVKLHKENIDLRNEDIRNKEEIRHLSVVVTKLNKLNSVR